MGKIIDLTGQKFGKLTVIKYYGLNSSNKALWNCVCDCGKECVVQGSLLRNGHTTSCGCRKKERLIESHTTHGLSNHPMYGTWINMKRRCYDSNDKSYMDYGGRGIKVCDEWLHDFQAFYDWSMSNGYEQGLSIDRIDNDGNYEPSNCRWVDMRTQANNTRRIHAITYMGKTQSMMDWCKELDLDYYTIRSRINIYHWSAEKAFTKTTRRKYHDL